jgi:hypothetical protein
MFRWTIALCDRICSVAGAIVFSQFPQFLQQYSQRLSGHMNELSLQVGLMQQAASQLGLSLQEYTEKFLANGTDPVFEKQGRIIQQLTERYQDLTLAYNSLQNASIYKRPFVFIANLKTDIALDTWNSFQPGIPTTLEGLVYAFVGMLFGITCFYTLRQLLKAIFRKLIGKPKPNALPAAPVK